MIDFVNEANQSRLKTIHDEVRSVRVCPNGRYVLTGGSKGDVILYSVRKQIPAEVQQMARQAFGNTNEQKPAPFGRTDFSRAQ